MAVKPHHAPPTATYCSTNRPPQAANTTATDNTNAAVSGDKHPPNRGTIFTNAYKDKHQPVSTTPRED